MFNFLLWPKIEIGTIYVYYDIFTLQYNTKYTIMANLQTIRHLKVILLCLTILSVIVIINNAVNKISYDFYNDYNNFNYSNCSILNNITNNVIHNITNSSNYLSTLTFCNCDDQLISLYNFNKLYIILYFISVIILLLVIYNSIKKLNKSIIPQLSLTHIYLIFSIIYLIPIIIFGSYIMFNLLYQNDKYNPLCYNLFLEQIKSDILRFLITYCIAFSLFGYICIEICCTKINKFKSHNLSINNNQYNQYEQNNIYNRTNNNNNDNENNYDNNDNYESELLIRKRPTFVKITEVVPPYSEN